MITKEQRDEALHTYKMYYLQNSNYAKGSCLDTQIEHERNKEVFDKAFELIIEYNLNNKARDREIVHMRQALMYCIRKHTSLSFVSIGKMFNRDHATVLHGIKNVKAGIKFKQVSEEMQFILDAITTHLQKTTSQHNAEVIEEGNSKIRLNLIP